MSDESRSLPSRPNLRFLKREARRRLAAGEFDTLHNAQLASASSRSDSYRRITATPPPVALALATAHEVMAGIEVRGLCVRWSSRAGGNENLV
jgi:hypothetical protein